MSTSFNILPIPSTIPPSPPLNLLPFALGPNSAPHTTKTAPINQHFQPRPCPPEYSLISGIPTGTPIAAFRGRQIVGQTLSVPKGYRGIVLSTGKRPDKGGLEVRAPSTSGPSNSSKPKWPLTPASSAASVMDEDEGLGLRRSPRKAANGKVRGSGQIALAQPKVRQVTTQPASRKRYRLDSDDESDDEDSSHTPVKKSRTRSGMTQTPTKGTKTSPLPEIVIVAPTPLKEPLPTPVKSLPKHTDSDEPNEVLKVEEADKVVEIGIIPSPATEDDPPLFDIPEAVKIEAEPDAEELNDRTGETAEELEETGNMRNLLPVSTFDSFTLWTPDVPLPGFKPDELHLKSVTATDGEEVGTATADIGPEGGEVKADSERDGFLNDGWWRVGGGGEGGDEFVRGLGEWLGLVEELNKPVYLDETKDDSDDEE